MLIELEVLIGPGSRKGGLPMTLTISLLLMIGRTKKRVIRGLPGGSLLRNLLGVSMLVGGDWLRGSMGLRLARGREVL